uniref:Uncharacterized protein n=1 Tax=Mimivirus LCMiAC01 TaxID=2506608 RepID=A0A481Z0R7_9VIRU|nr:MAG: hypothetical protein LCMiAC01_05320 [Mimivirus LCMiAC01]
MPAKIRQKIEEAAVAKYKESVEDRARSTAGYKNIFQEGGKFGEGRRAYSGKGDQNRRIIEGTLDDELPYSDYNHLPVAAGYKSHDYEYGWSFLPPEKWYPQPPRPPICVTEKRCPICPIYTKGTPVDAKEWHSSRRVHPPDMINTAYISDKIASGR